MSPKEFYTKQKTIFQSDYEKLKKQLLQISMVRLAVFVLTVAGVYFNFKDSVVAGFIFLLGVVVFIFLIFKHTDLIRKRDIALQKLEINKKELSSLNGTFYTKDHGSDFIDGSHEFSHDIDLFGEYSFFFYLNRTVTMEGRSRLAKLITSNHINLVEEKQEAIKELSKKVAWRQHFTALANLVKVNYSASHISDYITNYQSVFSKGTNRIPVLFSIISCIILGLTIFQVIGISIFILWFLLGMFITGSFLKRTQRIYNESSRAKDTFGQYYPLLEQIEKVEFATNKLRSQQEKIKGRKLKASRIFKDFSGILHAFDQRNNIVVALLGNFLFLYDLRNACRVERWIEEYKDVVSEWFEVISFFDAQNSLANFFFNHPEYQFPTISKGESCIIKATALGHPLLNKEGRIDNDFEIELGKFFIITGANMAGKSTFLRTVGLSLVMANMGLPVCATSFHFRPTKLITSMRTTDSLAQNESYFYAELKRLKYIVERMKEEQYFIILDEILKGTNSKDKAVGSRKFVEKLVNFNSTGVIATHDISLCDLEKDYDEIHNYFFEAEIKEGELFFDYILKEGICKNMNASFLLEKMKIV